MFGSGHPFCSNFSENNSSLEYKLKLSSNKKITNPIYYQDLSVVHGFSKDLTASPKLVYSHRLNPVNRIIIRTMLMERELFWKELGLCFAKLSTS